MLNDPAKNLNSMRSNTMADVVEEQLRALLKKDVIQTRRFPPKRKWTGRSPGVSRNVVREALSRLRMLGMIESRKRRGMVLVSPDILQAFERVLDPPIIDEATLEDIFEMRLVIEMGLADLLFIRMKPLT